MTHAVTRTILTRPLLLLVGGLLAVVGLTVSAPATAAPPQLSVGVDDGQAQTEGGATTRYTVTVTNLGGKTAHGLHVSQTVPDGATVGRVDHEGTTRKGTVRWSVDVPAGGSITLRSTLAVADELPSGLLRLATVVCVGTSADAPPTVCASDSDQLPAGAAAEQEQRRLEPSGGAAAVAPSWTPAAAAGTGLLVLVGLVGLVALARRRSRARRPPTSAPVP